jgi:hypothetical protein
MAAWSHNRIVPFGRLAVWPFGRLSVDNVYRAPNHRHRKLNSKWMLCVVDAPLVKVLADEHDPL